MNDDYDNFNDNRTAEMLKDLPDGIYKKDAEGKLVKI